MKKQFSVLRFVIVFWVFISTAVIANAVTLTKAGEWGGGLYRNVFVQDRYAYCSALGAGLDILDIGDPSNPKKIGNLPVGSDQDIWDVYVEGKYAYVVETHHLLVVDVSVPSAPVLVAGYLNNLLALPLKVVVSEGYAYLSDRISGFEVIDVRNPLNPVQVARKNNIHRDLFVAGDHLYVATPSGLWIYDVSDPLNTAHIATAEFGNWVEHVWVSGNYAYACGTKKAYIIDISNPLSPLSTGTFSLTYNTEALAAFSDHLYIANEKGVQVMDVSSPASPNVVGEYSPGEILDVFPKNGYLFAASGSRGLDVLDISTPGSPTLAGSYTGAGYTTDIFVKGNYAYVAAYDNGLKIIDVSQPSSPQQVAAVPTDTNAVAVHGSGNYVCVAGVDSKVYIVDVTTPASAKLAGTYSTGAYIYDVVSAGNYVYAAAGVEGLLIIDVSNPSAPAKAGQFDGEGGLDVSRVEVDGSYAYITTQAHELMVIDVSDPANPKRVTDLAPGGFANSMQVVGNYLYMYVWGEGLQVLDVSNPLAPVTVGEYDSDYGVGLSVGNDYVYLAGTQYGVLVLDVSTPTAPKIAGSYNNAKYMSNITVSGDYVYAVGGDSGGMTILHVSDSGLVPGLQLSRTRLYFAAGSDTEGIDSQSLLVSNSGQGNLSWTLSSNRDWLKFTPSSGNNSGEVFISVDSEGYSPGVYNGVITVTSPAAANSPKTVNVTMTVHQPGQTAAPFGAFATPIDGSTVQSSIPVTGWALDDTGIQSVQIFREDGNSLTYIGDASFVEGARPDVEAAYPGYPDNNKAGWGYMMLTNYLPYGDGVYRIHAVATDKEGNQTTLGVKTITVNNAGAVKPFGAIDTPPEGATITGSRYLNFGWALTPQPNTIPTDGTTITVWVDGNSVGHPVYNQYREDVANYFPGYNNSGGAVGYFYLDTTQYENGIHSIHWTAADDAGNTDGIGSRYIKIMNPAPRSAAADAASALRTKCKLTGEAVDRVPLDAFSPVQVKKGFDPDAPLQTVLPDENGVINIQIREMERIEVHFSGNTGEFARKLPIGCTWDRETGVLSWFPAHGFYGDYDFVLIADDGCRGKMKQHLRITISSKY